MSRDETQPQRILMMARGIPDGDDPEADGFPVSILADEDGQLIFTLGGFDPDGDFAQIFLGSLTDNLGARENVASDSILMGVANAPFEFDPGSVQFRLAESFELTDALAPDSANNEKYSSISWLYGFNGATFDRVRVGATDSDNVAELAEGAVQTASYLFGFDGGAFDRLRTISLNADAISDAVAGNLRVGSFNLGYNGTSFDRLRTQSSANAVLADNVGTLLTTPPCHSTDTDEPAANTAAQATIPAPLAGRNIITTFSATLACGATASGIVDVFVRDGAGGTILWSGKMSAPANGSRDIHNPPNFQVACSATTAAVLDVSAGGTDTEVTASIGAYTVQ